jgi:hypothetical protein
MDSGGGIEIRKIIFYLTLLWILHFLRNTTYTQRNQSPTRNGHTHIKVLYSQSEVILPKFKKLSFSTQTITHVNQHILTKYATNKHSIYLLKSLHHMSKINLLHQCISKVLIQFSSFKQRRIYQLPTTNMYRHNKVNKLLNYISTELILRRYEK